MGVVLSHRPPSIAHAEAARAGRRSGGRFVDRRSVGGCAVSRCAAWLVGGVRGRFVGCVVGWCRAWGVRGRCVGGMGCATAIGVV